MNRGLRKRKEILRKKIVSHHLRYAYNGLTHKQDERTLLIFHTEHYITRLLQTRGKYVSKGFLFVLADFILDRLITNNYTNLQESHTNTIKEEESDNTTSSNNKQNAQ